MAAEIDRDMAKGSQGRRRKRGRGRRLAESGPRSRSRARDAQRPVSGTQLVRDWQGTEHRVTVKADHYLYDGRPYASLSGIARSITGTRWNGPMFFGLRSAPRGRGA